MASPAPDRRPRPARPLGRVTFEEYLAFERRHPQRHEFVDGYVYAMAGARLRHNRIIGNVLLHLLPAAVPTPCEVYFEAAKLRVDDDVFYPDVMVTCEPAGDAEAEIAFAPCVLIEVLSPSTARTDRTAKRLTYTAQPSVQAYWLVSQDWRSVERHWLDGGGVWRLEHVDGEGAVPVPCLGRAPLTLDEICEGVDLPRVPPAPRRVREPLWDRWPEPAGA